MIVIIESMFVRIAGKTSCVTHRLNALARGFRERRIRE